MMLHIAEEDLKERYKPLRVQGRRIATFLKSIWKTFEVTVQYELKQHNTAAFTIVDDKGPLVSKETKKVVLEFLLGEICEPKSAAKYGTTPTQDTLEYKKPSLLAVEQKFSSLTISNLESHELKNVSGPLELRQFACQKCHHSWWRTVFSHKPVSRCRGGKCGAQRYDPLPRNKEFGIGRYNCSKCSRFFFAHCEFTDILYCRKCLGACSNPIIHPKWRKRRRKSTLNPNAKPFRQRKEVTGPLFFPQSSFDGARGTQAGAACVSPSTPSVSYSTPSASSSTPCVSFSNPPSSAVKRVTKGRSTNIQQTGSAGHAPSQPRHKTSQTIKRLHAFNPSLPHSPRESTISTFLSQTDHHSEHDLDYDDDIDDNLPYPRRFECRKCDGKYTVRCKMTNTAQCYQCGTNNSPLGPASADVIDRTTKYEHSCSECPKSGLGNCPNLR